MEDLVFRNVQEEDFIKIAELGAECEPMENESNQLYHIFTKYFKSTCLVAELSSGEIAGFLLGFISPENPLEFYIHLLCVDPKMRKRYIGRKLMEAFIQMAGSRGCKIVKLITKPINWNAITFYKKLGFMEEKTGETMNILGNTAIKNYDGPGAHMVIFYKSLDEKSDS